MSQLATVVAHLDEVCSLTWKILVLVYQLGVGLGAAGGMKVGVEVVLCIIDFALHEVVLVTILFLSEDDLGEELVDLGLRGMAPSVGANIEGELHDCAFEGLGKDSVGGERS